MDNKFQEITEDELTQVVGGRTSGPIISGVIGTAVAPGVLSGVLGEPLASKPVIDPADVISMDILKDAAATAIYGSKNK